MFFDMGLGKTITMSMVAADYINRAKKFCMLGQVRAGLTETE